MEELKTRIEQIIKENKNYFSVLSRPKYALLFNEIKLFTSFLPETASISQRLYHILNENVQNKCPMGKDKIFYNITKGYGDHDCCGKEPVCKCYREHHGAVIKEFQASKTPEEKAATNELRRQTTLEKYGVEYIGQLEDTKEKMKQTCMERYGVDNTLKVPEIRERQKETLMKNYNVTNPFLSPEIQLKSQETCLERYGVKYTCLTDIVINARKKTLSKQYGVEHALQSPELQNKKNETCIERYDTIYPQTLEEFKNKAKATCFEHYGVEYGIQSEEVQDKMKKTMMERYGVEYPMQDPVLAQKASASSITFKPYTFPSGRVEKVQGYEPIALDILLSAGINEDDIRVKRTDMPEIWWFDSDNKKHRYYPDIFILSLNKLIEIKSSWTNREELKENIERKLQAARELGYIVELIVY